MSPKLMAAAVKKHLAYARYLARHKCFVFLAGLRTGAPIWRLIIHDLSKLRPSEWRPYVEHFYGSPEAKNEETMEAFRRYSICELAPYGHFARDRYLIAWNHHQKRNPHHWQYWLITEDSGETWPLPMPEHFVREMVADWAGAGRAITGKWDVSEWYQKNRDRILLRDETRVRVHEILSVWICEQLEIV